MHSTTGLAGRLIQLAMCMTWLNASGITLAVVAALCAGIHSAVDHDSVGVTPVGINRGGVEKGKN